MFNHFLEQFDKMNSVKLIIRAKFKNDLIATLPFTCATSVGTLNILIYVNV